MRKGNSKSTNNKKRGAVLPLVVFLTLVLSMLGFAILRLGMDARIKAVYATTEMSARSAADSGISQAIGLLNKKIESEMVWDDSNIPSTGNSPLPNCNASYSYKITGDSGSGFSITSVGQANGKLKTITTELKLKGLYDYAIFADSDIELKMGTTVDGFNYDADSPLLQIGTNSIEEDAIGLKSFITVEGDVIIGPGGDSDIVVDNKLDATVTGDFISLPQVWDLPIVTAPDSLIGIPSSGTISGGEVITTSGRYENIHITGTNEKVIIDGSVTLYIVGETEIGNTCTVEIVDLATNPDASLILYLGGNFIQKPDSHILNNTGDPKRLTIYGMEGCINISFLADTTYCGTIYAPNAELHLLNSVEIFGSVVVDYFEQHVTADFHYDASLQEVNINDIGAYFAVSRWHEE